MPPPVRALRRNAFQQLHVRKPQQPLSRASWTMMYSPIKPEDDEQEQEVPLVFETRQRHRAQQRHCHIRTHRGPYEVTM